MIVNVKQTPEAAKQRQRMKLYFDTRRAAGLCLMCGQPRPPENKSLCDACYKKRSSWAHEKYMMDKEIGLCHVCEKNAVREGKTTCEECAKRRAEQRKVLKEKDTEAYKRQTKKAIDSHKATYAQRKAAGLCVKCGKTPAESGHTTCDSCAAIIRQKLKEKSMRLVLQGRCQRCGQINDDTQWLSCSKCREKARKDKTR